MVNLTIDGRAVQAKKGSTILDVARENGIFIPTLCYHQALHPIGSCRICVVEVKPGPPRPLPACATYVNEGMEVTTTSPKLEAIRDELMKLVLINHAVECPICDKGGECELQNLTHALGIKKVDLEAVKLSPRFDYESIFVERHQDRCVTCGRCVRICKERVGAWSWNFVHRGYFTQLSSGELPLNCEFCGSCIDICPVGALINKQWKYRARAWEVDKTEIACPFCGGGCTYHLHTKDGQILRARNEDSVLLCGRGRFGWPVVESPDRLKTPLIKENDKFREASWEEALDLVGATLRANPDLPDHVRVALEEQMRQLQSELASSPPDEQAVVSDEQIGIVRRGWDGSDTLDDHRECAECLHALGRWAEALGEYRAAVRKGLPLNRILPQLADCLSRAYPPPAVSDETARFATGMLRDPGGIFHFELIMAERMAAEIGRVHPLLARYMPMPAETWQDVEGKSFSQT